jgi:hypothetical protein
VNIFICTSVNCTLYCTTNSVISFYRYFLSHCLKKSLVSVPHNLLFVYELHTWQAQILNIYQFEICFCKQVYKWCIFCAFLFQQTVFQVIAWFGIFIKNDCVDAMNTRIQIATFILFVSHFELCLLPVLCCKHTHTHTHTHTNVPGYQIQIVWLFPRKVRYKTKEWKFYADFMLSEPDDMSVPN